MIQDVHAQTALELFGIVNPDTRARAKAINYLAQYSASEITLSRRLGIYPRPHMSLFDLMESANG